jgi:hypothetical protein
MTTLTIMPFSIATLSIMPFGMTMLYIMPFSMTTLSIMGLHWKPWVQKPGGLIKRGR